MQLRSLVLGSALTLFLARSLNPAALIMMTPCMALAALSLRLLSKIFKGLLILFMVALAAAMVSTPKFGRGRLVA